MGAISTSCPDCRNQNIRMRKVPEIIIQAYLFILKMRKLRQMETTLFKDTTCFGWEYLELPDSKSSALYSGEQECVCAKSLQLCPTLCDPMDCNPPGSSVHGILQARLLEWVAMPFSRESSRPRDRTHVSCGSCIAGAFFTAEPLGKPGNKRVLFKLPGNRWVVLCIFSLWFHFSVFWLMFLLFLSQAFSCSQWEDRLI